jgi:PAS domain S-box-containing protein
MTQDRDSKTRISELRKRAEAAFAEDTRDAASNISALSPEDAQKLVHELQVHQIELEMQNDELRRAQVNLEESKDRYLDLYDFAPVGYVTLNEKGLVLETNLSAIRLLGEERQTVINRPFSRFVCQEFGDAFHIHLQQVFETQSKQICEIDMKRTVGNRFHAQLESVSVQDGSGQFERCRTIVSDITGRKKVEDCQSFLVEAGYRDPEEDFFEALAKYLAKSLDMDFVCIDRLKSDGLTAQTLAVHFDGKFEDNIEYALKDTPCGEVVGKVICSFPRDVRQMFPNDAVLQEMMAESYIGVTLWSSKGEPIGLIAVIGRQPSSDLRLAEMILKLVAVRAAGELERREADEALRKSEKRLSRVLESISDGFFVLNYDLVVTYFNKAAEDLLGRKREDVIGRQLFEAFPEAKGSIFEQNYTKAIHQKSALLFETYFGMEPYDNWYEVRAYPFEGGISVYFQDTTERKRAEQALKNSEELSHAVFESTDDAIYIKDGSLRFQHVNSAMCRLVGLPGEAIVARKAEDIYGEEQGQLINEREARVLEGESIDIEHTIIVQDTPMIFHDVLVPLKNLTGDIVGVYCISRNITDRKAVSAKQATENRVYPSRAMQRTFDDALVAAKSDSIILLQGESGSGKDFLARWIHDQSHRSRGPYFSLNCAAVPHDLAESELFGHERGSFTGAQGLKRGLLELAEGGTILLNEIGELSLAIQSKLLAFLDTRSFVRVGGQKHVHVNARLIAASHGISGRKSK